VTITEDATLTTETESPAPVAVSLVLPAEYALRAIRGALVAASKDYARPILCAVLITVSKGMAEIVATDSYRLVTVTFAAPDSPDGSLLVSRDVLASLVKCYSKSAVSKLSTGQMLVIRSTENAGYEGIPLEIVHPTGTITAADGHQGGTFPDVHQLIPDGPGVGVPMVAFNPAYLADVGKVAAEIAECPASPVRVETWDATKPARFTVLGGNNGDRDLIALYLLMPVRVS
jgi:DNA polymerase III sliding clamp (beta) subunit (PCNA family)